MTFQKTQADLGAALISSPSRLQLSIVYILAKTPVTSVDHTYNISMPHTRSTDFVVCTFATTLWQHCLLISRCMASTALILHKQNPSSGATNAWENVLQAAVLQLARHPNAVVVTHTAIHNLTMPMNEALHKLLMPQATHIFATMVATRIDAMRTSAASFCDLVVTARSRTAAYEPYALLPASQITSPGNAKPKIREAWSCSGMAWPREAITEGISMAACKESTAALCAMDGIPETADAAFMPTRRDPL
jgi:hypothetical protein